MKWLFVVGITCGAGFAALRRRQGRRIVRRLDYGVVGCVDAREFLRG